MIQELSELTSDYVGPVVGIKMFPHKYEIPYTRSWIVTASTPQFCKNIVDKGVVQMKKDSFECVVPCQFSGIRAFLPDTQKNECVVDPIFMVTKPEEGSWCFYEKNTENRIKRIDNEQDIVVIDNRYLCFYPLLVTRSTDHIKFVKLPFLLDTDFKNIEISHVSFLFSICKILLKKEGERHFTKYTVNFTDGSIKKD